MWAKSGLPLSSQWREAVLESNSSHPSLEQLNHSPGEVSLSISCSQRQSRWLHQALRLGSPLSFRQWFNISIASAPFAPRLPEVLLLIFLVPLSPAIPVLPLSFTVLFINWCMTLFIQCLYPLLPLLFADYILLFISSCCFHLAIHPRWAPRWTLKVFDILKKPPPLNLAFPLRELHLNVLSHLSPQLWETYCATSCCVSLWVCSLLVHTKCCCRWCSRGWEQPPAHSPVINIILSVIMRLEPVGSHLVQDHLCQKWSPLISRRLGDVFIFCWLQETCLIPDSCWRSS